MLSVLNATVDVRGYVLDGKEGSGVYFIRERTAEEERAVKLRSFFVALRKEGFSEDQAMQILLRTLDEESDED